MSKFNNGGPAFPQLENEEIFTMHDGEYNYTESEYMPKSVGGMSLWDYFAAAALQGELAAQVNFAGWDTPSLAFRAAAAADAMLAERAKREGGSDGTE